MKLFQIDSGHHSVKFFLVVAAVAGSRPWLIVTQQTWPVTTLCYIALHHRLPFTSQLHTSYKASWPLTRAPVSIMIQLVTQTKYSFSRVKVKMNFPGSSLCDSRGGRLWLPETSGPWGPPAHPPWGFLRPWPVLPVHQCPRTQDIRVGIQEGQPQAQQGGVPLTEGPHI